ncbi:BON domain-containing protein [Paraburkholderia silvatlantica]|uniref:BON domain-containing protein n=1 Tax=Paraburkholderia silvatlantica TaxID=321895 RepID=A0A2U1AJ17_9BURK|nr:BON domain-containing protein [Paraburkholderia silvatlantica]MBB2927672.1 osmotically-inducible protein OsmY [Paraburkholderia silvatlantica]PVY36380.1 BON domain-containing protein [Paraburkholderia silvatlantica]PXW40203.1 BON domain-containing protein [Paraburkholderia silvatlantica]PYE20455.1 BON domain-containing protein [Paraburkholderia silvatlantica]TDQ85406.1 BON domain-containing protein [Paraburkholderia silvatlantica]
MKAVITSTLVLLMSGAMVPAVQAQTGSGASDSQLAHSVRVAFARNGVNTSHVFVFARGGAVTLLGWVDAHEQVALAERTAASVEGVQSVDSWLARGR